MTVTYDSLATVAITSDTAAITFSSISANFTDLRLIVSAVGNSGAIGQNLAMLLGMGSGYTQTQIGFNGSNVTQGRLTSQTALYPGWYTNFSTTETLLCYIDILDYASNRRKEVISVAGKGSQTLASNRIDLTAGSVNQTFAIDQIDLVPTAGSFAAGTVVALYGIKKE